MMPVDLFILAPAPSTEHRLRAEIRARQGADLPYFKKYLSNLLTCAAKCVILQEMIEAHLKMSTPAITPRRPGWAKGFGAEDDRRARRDSGNAENIRLAVAYLRSAIQYPFLRNAGEEIAVSTAFLFPFGRESRGAVQWRALPRDLCFLFSACNAKDPRSMITYDHV